MQASLILSEIILNKQLKIKEIKPITDWFTKLQPLNE